MTQVSIIIVSWNVRDLLKKCIESIFEFSKGLKNFEIIVVDNNSSDGTVLMLQKEFLAPNIRIIANNKNRGFAAANNQGIKESKAKYALFLNPDAEFLEDTLLKVYAKMEQDEKNGILGCVLLNSNMTVQPSVRRFPRFFDIFFLFFKIYKIFPKILNHYLAKDFDYSLETVYKSSEVDQVMGAFMFVRRSVLEKIGFFDEQYFIWFEEVDFCRRAKLAGYKIIFWKGAKIIHHGGKSFAQRMTLKKQFWFFRSALRYFIKYF
jgi:GT2 family glycosyltransferase